MQQEGKGHTHKFCGFFDCTCKAVDDAAITANVSAAVSIEPFLTKDLDEVLVRRPRMQEQR